MMGVADGDSLVRDVYMNIWRKCLRQVLECGSKAAAFPPTCILLPNEIERIWDALK
jgi:hypothetical protein